MSLRPVRQARASGAGARRRLMLVFASARFARTASATAAISDARPATRTHNAGFAPGKPAAKDPRSAAARRRRRALPAGRTRAQARSWAFLSIHHRQGNGHGWLPILINLGPIE